MSRLKGVGKILLLLLSLALGALALPATVSADSPNIDFRLLYQAAKFANQAYRGESEILGKFPSKSAWVSTPGHTHVQYVLIHNHKRKMQAIAVRGTVDDVNWDLDMDTRGVKDRKAGILLHSGFKKAAETIYRELKPRLKRRYKTHLTGHSLGGAVAAILGMYLTDDGYRVAGIYTFGQPKFTNIAGARAYRNLPLLRVVNRNDTVAVLPDTTSKSRQQYAHMGAIINLLSGPYYVYGTSEQAIQFSPGTLGKFFTQISVPDHKMKNYLKGIREKFDGAKRVSYRDRVKYIVRRLPGRPPDGDWERKTNFNHHR